MRPSVPASHLARATMRSVARVCVSHTGHAMTTAASRGSLTLLQLPGRRVGVTCRHVIDAYLERVGFAPATRFRVGNRALEPTERILAEDPRRDLVILDLDDMDADELSDGSRGLEFFTPSSWPLCRARPGDSIAVGTCVHPGTSSSADERDGLGLEIYREAPGVTRVLDVGSENIVCEVRWDGWPEGLARHARDVVAALGGLSGAPGFVSRDSVVHLVGIVFAGAEHGGYLRLRPADLIGSDGTLRHD